MTSRFSLHRSLPRGMAACLMALSMALWGCAGEEISGLNGGPLGKKGTPAPSTTGLGGAVQTGPTPSPTVAPTPTPTPPPTGSPSPTPTPEPLPTPFAMGIHIALATNSINLAPVGGGTPLYPYTTHVSGTVTLSNALTSTDIDWRSSNPAVATVTSDGTVTAGSTTGGTIQITGTSKDGLVSDSLNLTVTTFGGAEVVVD